MEISLTLIVNLPWLWEFLFWVIEKVFIQVHLNVQIQKGEGIPLSKLVPQLKVQPHLSITTCWSAQRVWGDVYNSATEKAKK